MELWRIGSRTCFSARFECHDDVGVTSNLPQKCRKPNEIAKAPPIIGHCPSPSCAVMSGYRGVVGVGVVVLGACQCQPRQPPVSKMLRKSVFVPDLYMLSTMPPPTAVVFFHNSNSSRCAGLSLLCIALTVIS